MPDLVAGEYREPPERVNTSYYDHILPPSTRGNAHRLNAPLTPVQSYQRPSSPAGDLHERTDTKTSGIQLSHQAARPAAVFDVTVVRTYAPDGASGSDCAAVPGGFGNHRCCGIVYGRFSTAQDPGREHPRLGCERHRFHHGIPAAGFAYEAMINGIGTMLSDPIKAAILQQGIRGTLIDSPAPPDLTNAPITQGWAATNPWGQNPVTMNDAQAFPLIGWIEVEWRLPPSIIAREIPPRGWEIVQRHLDEMRRSSGASAGRSAVATTGAASALITDVVSDAAVGVRGRWRYRLQGAAGQAGESGLLWLRTSGSYVQGVMEAAQKQKDMLEGTIAEGGRVLRLTRSTSRGEVQKVILTRNGSAFAGTLEGTQRRMEITPFP